MTTQNFSFGYCLRSSPNFIISTIAVGLFTNLFVYGIVVPILPFMLRDRFQLPDSEMQSYTSKLLATYSASAVLFSIPAGWLADNVKSRRLPYLAGLLFLLTSTVLFVFGQSIFILVVARILQGMSAAVVWSVGFAIILETVGKGRTGQVLGTIYSFSTIAQLISPVLGGILYHASGIMAVFGVAMGVTTIDLVMRLLIIENKADGQCLGDDIDQTSNERASPEGQVEPTARSREYHPLLPKDNETTYRVPDDVGYLIQSVPVLYCFRNPRFLTAMLTSLTQAMIISMFDATISTEVNSLFHFSSLQVGLFYIALITPCTLFGWLFGQIVDKHGTRVVSTAGYAFMVPCLVLLGLPSQHFVSEHVKVTLYTSFLVLNGVGLSIISLPSFVEASDVLKNYEAANPPFFGEHGSYAQLYGFNSLFYFSGLTIGPLLGGTLRGCIGYGGMSAGFAVLSAVIAVLSFLFMGKRRSNEIA